MSRALGPRVPVTGSSASPAWMVLGLCLIPAGIAGLIWAGAHAAAAIAGGRVEPYGFGFAADVAASRWRQAWPGVPPGLVWGCTGAIAAAIIAAAAVVWLRAAPRLLAAPGDPLTTLAAHRRQHEPLTLGPVQHKAVQLRPSLRGRSPAQVSADDAGMVLGDLLRPGGRRGPTLYSSWEETEVDFMGPRAGKTTARAIPLTIAAPGACLATSNKADLWAATAEIRARKGMTWLFDPCSITHQRQGFWVDLLSPVRTVETAHRLSSHFVLTVEDPQKRELWGPAAQTLLTCLFLAASTSGRTMNDVARWLDQPGMPGPAVILQEAGFGNLASSLVGTQQGAPETRDGIYETARTAAKALRDDEVISWVTPRHDLPCFDPVVFPGSSDTLYLLSESQSYASPLVAAVTDVVIRSGLKLAQQSGGRLDPPLPMILDECANICRIADLPAMYSYLGSHGITPVTILQSYEQGTVVWGEAGMAALWGAATVKLIGAGVDSPKLTREISDLVGPHDVTTRSIGLGEARGISENLSYRRQPLFEVADVRAIEKGRALLLTSGIRPAVVKLRNWFTGPRKNEIAAAISHAQQLIQAGALRETKETVK